MPNIYFTVDNRPLTTYKLQVEEVAGIFALDLDQLLKLHSGEISSFKTSGLNTSGQPYELDVTKDSFPENWDDFHSQIATLVKVFLEK